MKYTKTVNRTLKGVTATILVVALAFVPLASKFESGNNRASASTYEGEVKKVDTKDVNTSLKDYLDQSTTYELSDNVTDNQDISVIVSLNSSEGLLNTYNSNSAINSVQSVAEYVYSEDGSAKSSEISSQISSLKSRISKSNISCTFGEEYNVLLSGFEVTIKAKNFYKLSKLVGDDADLIVGEEYEKCETEVVENIVDIDASTGIFNSSGSGYDGSGTVIAVLDTGLDYTHSAFDVSRFEGDEVITLDSISQIIDQSTAATMTSGLTASDVYINRKVPFAYDYADKDSDVYPLNSSHGTHVSGVIVGNDDTIRGVAPNAQLVSMKVFSDTQDSSRTSWLLAALEDCVLLNVDVINMSLGSSCGFSNSQDDLRIEKVYQSIKDAGISLVVAASNSYSSSLGSTKNGNLGLTSNPDTATVGAPSTYSAALSVASISGVKTPYLLYGDEIIYFNEATDKSATSRDFVSEILGSNQSATFEYVTIPGVGRTADYSGLDVTGKIVLVKRGSTTFEDKVRIAGRQGAAGIIIYNNVSGTISMSTGAGSLPSCSISQDDGKLLAEKGSGTLVISKSQVAGPYMSDFSSWGPTPDLKIKPEITAHGGDILSSVPGQSYERLSGTSMATPNQSGVTALIRQYVKETFPNLTATEVTARVNQIMMSTADIVYNKNGLPNAVRKQGAGLANLTAATTTPAYISTYDTDGNEMDKAKLELGDDAKKTGVYTMKFAVNNISGTSLTYDVNAIVMTEGVSETLTARGDTTVTEEGYLLGAGTTIKSVSGGTSNGNSITVRANSSAIVELQVTLTDDDKQYLDKSFSNGMYIEGFVTLTAKDGTTIDLNVPYLAFYGDWNQAPLFDLDYFATNADELNSALDADQKTMADGYATMPIGRLYDDYITYLGSYAYAQNPSATQIAASRDHIALTNQSGESGGVNGIYSIWAGMLRGADHIDIKIYNTVTKEVIYSDTQYNQSKSYNNSGSISMSVIGFDFCLDDYDLKNNTQYTVLLEAYTAYGDGGKNTNKNNTFEFTFTTDFQAPVVTGCTFYTEYDSSAKKTRLFANIDVYDNHYSQAAAVGMIVDYSDPNSAYYDPSAQYTYGMVTFDKYLTALYSSYNSTYTMTYELTDYIDLISNSYNGNSFMVELIDYALNTSIYEITIPDSVTAIQSFVDSNGNKIESLTLSPNEVYSLDLEIADGDTGWTKTVSLSSSDESIVGLVDGKLIARASGTATITAVSNSNPDVKKQLVVTVLKEGDSEYVKYDKPVTDSFTLTEYYIDKAYYFVTSSSRDLGIQGDTVKFGGTSYALSFYPSEAVTIKYDLKAYFPDDVKVVFESGNDSIVTVDENGKITAVAEGTASVSVRVLMDGKSTYYSNTISITVKNPFITSGSYLTGYYGLGGEVTIPDDLGLTEISSYAFSDYEYVEKDENDEISEEDPSLTKASPLGENTITKVIIPEGVKTIDYYAFAYLTALEEVVLPSTLTKIQSNAFEGCTSLKKINLENVQFINQKAFYNCPIEQLNLDSIVAIGNYSFGFDDSVTDSKGNAVTSQFDTLILPASAQSLGEGAFYNCTKLSKVTFKASSVKLGSAAFAYCTELTSAVVNASVIPSSTFQGCTKLNSITIGRDVSVIGQFAFADTNITKFTVDSENTTFKTNTSGNCILSKDGKTLVVVSPKLISLVASTSGLDSVVTISDGAFSGNSNITTVTLPNVTKVNSYAFAACINLSRVTLGQLESIGSYAFAECSQLKSMPSLEKVTQIGSYSFYGCTGISSVTIPDGVTIGDYAFAYCGTITDVTIGNDVTIGEGAFYAPVSQASDYDLYYTESGAYQDSYGYYLIYYGLTTEGNIKNVTIGDNAVIGNSAFYGQMKLSNLTLGEGAVIGDTAFYLNTSLESVDLSKVKEIGDSAFSGEYVYIYAATYNANTSSISAVYIYGYKFYSSALTSVDLSSIRKIGPGAFGYATALKSVKLGSDIKSIDSGAFFYCTSLEEIDLGNVESIGSYAFYDCNLTDVNLSKAPNIGAYAFYGNDDLTKVTLAENSVLGECAFQSATKLSNVNTKDVAVFGNLAFAGCDSLTSVDLSSAVSIGDFAFGSSGVTSVTFGTGKLTYIGENPFASCALGDFTATVAGKETNTFTISENVFVDNGVLYYNIKNVGLQLVSYPALKEDVDYTVLSNTIRISAEAFISNFNLASVELPYELKSIGDMAFYGCESLAVVVFNSVSAPILEEQYDENYQQYSNLPFTGYMDHLDEYDQDYLEANGVNLDDYKGLGIVPYFMWNSDAASYFYGATFKNYIGYATTPTVFVAPANGELYTSFVISRYYTKLVYGAAAPYQTTLDAIAAINALPDLVSLDNEAAVEAARAAYDLIATTEQQALVTNYDKLTSAENTIEYLKRLEENNTGDDDQIVTEPKEDNFLPLAITFIVVSGVLVLAVAAVVVLWLLDRKRYVGLAKKASDKDKSND